MKRLWHAWGMLAAPYAAFYICQHLYAAPWDSPIGKYLAIIVVGLNGLVGALECLLEVIKWLSN